MTLDPRVKRAIKATPASRAFRGLRVKNGTLVKRLSSPSLKTLPSPANFKTSVDDITTPNLFKALDEYHVNLSAADSPLNIPLKNLILTYQRTAATTARITIAAKDTAVPVLTDMRRVTIYNSTSVESQTYNNTRVSTRTVLDEIVYIDSQESHSMKICQQDPKTGLWSLCEIHTFISAGGARTSVWIQWSEIDVSYEAPIA